ncbi:MAG: hypothetical protein QM809_12495 [Gordonia sp. (in: high G+C Gram-positive bacteria)]|uniref:hypothetical protein n=1 Tax=Gordonia sp. (in: high G+C Gram-positive bacteria) TaxID=84139 RepID=UPI0039E29C57
MLGYPVRDHTVLEETPEQDAGLVQAFDADVLYAFAGAERPALVGGVIGSRWAEEGYETGPLEYPLAD